MVTADATGNSGRQDRHRSGTQRTGRTGPVQSARDEATVLARKIAGGVPDPELPMLTLADLGILRAVAVEGGRVVVSLTPTYSGCPAIDVIRADVHARLADAGLPDAEIRTVLNPPWSTDWITAAGRRKLAAAGIAPPAAGRARPAAAGPVPLTLTAAPARVLPCPVCGSARTERTAAFGSTACKDLYRCRACAEPFEHMKEI
jgi:ring-1,2-phenylacetyl-CoA epoxidase subunit PaaD